jgi:hypothetical protein
MGSSYQKPTYSKREVDDFIADLESQITVAASPSGCQTLVSVSAISACSPDNTIHMATSGIQWGTHDIPIDSAHITEFHFGVSLTPPAYHEGTLFYDNGDKTLTFYNEESAVALQIGQEMWVRCKNTTGSLIPNGYACYFDGAVGGSNNPTVALVSANAVNADDIIGIATHDIAHNDFGYVVTTGIVRDINTQSTVGNAVGDLTEGAFVYVDPARPGGLTSTQPTWPDHPIRVGHCVQRGNNGSIYVTIEPGGELQDVHDVVLINPEEDDLLTYNASTSAWENKQRHTITKPVTSITTDMSVSITDHFHVRVDASAGDVTLTLPTPVSVGQEFHFKKIDASTNNVILSGYTTDTVDGNDFVQFNIPYETLPLMGGTTTEWDII